MEKLPIRTFNFETIETYRFLNEANKELFSLSELIKQVDNPTLILWLITLKEAECSSKIEGIISTQTELFENQIGIETNSATKEAAQYFEAIKYGVNSLNLDGGMRKKTVCEIASYLNQKGIVYRKTPGTVLKNESTQEIIYCPPSPEKVEDLMDNFLSHFNECKFVDPLVEMSILHHQFESIHPFYDGNGRTGRVLNILYLVHKEILTSPLLYLSGYIVRNKIDYYKYLQEVRDTGDWQGYINFMLTGVKETSKETKELINQIIELKERVRNIISFKNNDLVLEVIFKYAVIDVDKYGQEIGVSSKTARDQLSKLEQLGILNKKRKSKKFYYYNTELIKLVS
jgi:Fic family protein